MFGNLYDAIRDMKSGVYDFTVDSQCSGCGQCCSNFLPVSDKEIRQIKRYIDKHKIKEQRHFVPSAGEYVDLTCPFRDNTGHRCVIYEVRPAICRDFQCDKPKKGIMANRAMYEGKYRGINVRETFYPAKGVDVD